MAKITVVTLVYNPGEYIYPCVDSVLGQTFTDFEFVIIDNASSDGTKEVLEEYAAKDARIKLLRNEENNVKFIDESYVSTEYYMILDHDDYLESDALECLYSLAIKEDLDIVYAKSELVDAKGRPIDERGISEDIACFFGDEIWRYFGRLYWQMRTLWGKLIRRDMMKYADKGTLKKREKAYYAGDTVVMLSMSFAAKRLGTINKVMHHYRVLERSESKNYCRDRFLADWVLYDQARSLLEKQSGLTEENEIYLQRVYCSAICDTFRIATRSNASDAIKMEIMKEIIVKEHTSTMIKKLWTYNTEEYRLFIDMFGRFLVESYVKNDKTQEYRELAFLWQRLLYGAENIREDEYTFLYEKYRGIMLLLCLGQGEQVYHDMEKTECPEQCPVLYLSLALQYEKSVKRMAEILLRAGKQNLELYHRADNVIRILYEQNGILRGIDFMVLEDHPDIVAAVCAEEYITAANRCMELLSLEEWQKNGGILELAITLAAILEDAEAFVMLKKCSCEFYINEGKPEEAKAVLADLKEMCPEDEEVELLRSALN